MRRQFRMIAAMLVAILMISAMPFGARVNAEPVKDTLDHINYACSEQEYNGEKCKVEINYDSKGVLDIVCLFDTVPQKAFEIILNHGKSFVTSYSCMACIGDLESDSRVLGSTSIDVDYDPADTIAAYQYNIPSNCPFGNKSQIDSIFNEITVASMNSINSAMISLFDVSLGDLGFKNFEALDKTMPDITVLCGDDVKVDLTYIVFDKPFTKVTVDGVEFEYRITTLIEDIILEGRFGDSALINIRINSESNLSSYIAVQYNDSAKEAAQVLVAELPVDYNPDKSDLFFVNVLVPKQMVASRKEMSDDCNAMAKLLFKVCEPDLRSHGFDYKDLGLTNYYGATAIPTSTVTKAPTKAPTATPTAAPTKVPTVAPTKAPSELKPTTPAVSTGVNDFIERLYTVALGRDFDEGGKKYWTEQIIYNGKSGADIAYDFLYSPEFLGKSMSQDDFLTVLYRTFFDREPDASGLKFWKEQMSAGQTKEWVIAGFVNSEEWANICLSFGIRSGSSVAPTIHITPNEQVIGFTKRLYTSCLDRSYDLLGLDYWADELANLKRSGSEVARGFFFSDEFIDNKSSNAEYVLRLYMTMMGRTPEQEGILYWVSQLNTGSMNRMDVFNGFAASKEWAEICADYGILK